MNQCIEAAAVHAFLVRHLAEVFSTMLSLPAIPLAEITPGTVKERVSGSVGFAGETVTGAVYLNLPIALATQVTAVMLGLPAEEAPADSDVNDVIGEVTNMLAGGLKSWLCDAGATCALTTPAIIRGNSFHIQHAEGVTLIKFGFECGEHHGLVETHIKFSN